MSLSCRSGNSSSRSLGSSPGSSPCCPASSCGSSRPSTQGPSRDLCSSGLCPRGPCPQSAYQVICWEPSGCGRSRCCPRVSMMGSPCQAPSPGALGQGSSSSCSLGSGSSGLRPLGPGVCGVPALSPGSGSGSCRPTYRPSGSCQSSCQRPACGSNRC